MVNPLLFPPSHDENEKALWVPFGGAAVSWLIFSEGLSFFLAQDPSERASVLGLNAVLWALSLLNLLVLGRLASLVFKVIDSPPEFNAAYQVQIGVWGCFKLVCLGLFTIVLLKGSPIPLLSVFLGMSTWIVVPLAGGFFWSQRILKNA
ncbi:MAG: hypothetical protein ACO3A2_11365 [Bdellovibrionia bacterium]